MTKDDNSVLKKQTEANAGLIPMEEARDIATRFVSQCKPDYGNISISAVDSQDGSWWVRGSTSKSGTSSYGSYHWTVTISGKDVVKYDFKPGFAFAIGRAH